MTEPQITHGRCPLRRCERTVTLTQANPQALPTAAGGCAEQKGCEKAGRACRGAMMVHRKALRLSGAFGYTDPPGYA